MLEDVQTELGALRERVFRAWDAQAGGEQWQPLRSLLQSAELGCSWKDRAAAADRIFRPSVRTCLLRTAMLSATMCLLSPNSSAGTVGSLRSAAPAAVHVTAVPRQAVVQPALFL